MGQKSPGGGIYQDSALIRKRGNEGAGQEKRIRPRRGHGNIKNNDAGWELVKLSGLICGPNVSDVILHLRRWQRQQALRQEFSMPL